MELIGWLALRLSLAYVYLFALYMNVRDAAARKWLIEHTAYMFESIPEPRRSRIAKWVAVLGMVIMLAGGVSIGLGLEGRIGAAALLFFTAGGIYQHACERRVATRVATRLDSAVPAEAKGDAATLQWSAFSGHFSSGLKNWALCGAWAAIVMLGTGPASISDRVLRNLLEH